MPEIENLLVNRIWIEVIIMEVGLTTNKPGVCIKREIWTLGR